ncbi:Permease, probably tetracycline resistance protein [Bacillus thuringiensis IBL 4222]|nr:Permease, probably tetracycline resistance protein [Bacillus thuringiensis IBL 4222]
MIILKPIPQRNTEISPNSKACLSMLFSVFLSFCDLNIDI